MDSTRGCRGLTRIVLLWGRRFQSWMSLIHLQWSFLCNFWYSYKRCFQDADGFNAMTWSMVRQFFPHICGADFAKCHPIHSTHAKVPIMNDTHPSQMRFCMSFVAFIQRWFHDADGLYAAIWLIVKPFLVTFVGQILLNAIQSAAPIPSFQSWMSLIHPQYGFLCNFWYSYKDDGFMMQMDSMLWFGHWYKAIFGDICGADFAKCLHPIHSPHAKLLIFCWHLQGRFWQKSSSNLQHPCQVPNHECHSLLIYPKWVSVCHLRHSYKDGFMMQMDSMLRYG